MKYYLIIFYKIKKNNGSKNDGRIKKKDGINEK